MRFLLTFRYFLLKTLLNPHVPLMCPKELRYRNQRPLNLLKLVYAKKSEVEIKIIFPPTFSRSKADG